MGYEKFMDAVRRRIAERGVKQTFLAEKVGMSPQNFSAKMRGVSRFTIDQISQLMKVLDIPADTLL